MCTCARHAPLPLRILTPLQPTQDSLSAAAQGHAIDSCVSQLGRRFDSRLGGFGGPPKFPRPSEINVMLAQYVRLVAAGEQDAAREHLMRVLCCSLIDIGGGVMG